MSKDEPTKSVNADHISDIELQLGNLRPAKSELDHAQTMYMAGQAAAHSAATTKNRTPRRTAATVMMALCAGLLIGFVVRPDPKPEIVYRSDATEQKTPGTTGEKDRPPKQEFYSGGDQDIASGFDKDRLDRALARPDSLARLRHAMFTGEAAPEMPSRSRSAPGSPARQREMLKKWLGT